MNADQGSRRAPGHLLRVAAGAGAAALIVTAVSAARRARAAMADREWPADATGPGARSGSADRGDGAGYPDVSPTPAAPEAVRPATWLSARSRSARRCCSSAPPRCRLSPGRRRADGKRGAAHARTSGRRDENGNDAGQPRHDVQRPQHTDDYPSWPGRPGPYALHPDHPSWGEDVPTRAGIAPRRPCGRTATPAGPSPRLRPGATPNRRRMTLPAGAVAEDPRDDNRRPRRTAARTVGQRRAMLPG